MQIYILLFDYATSGGVSLDKEQESGRANFSKKTISQERARAIELSFTASRLLDEKYYDDISKAIRTNDKALFIKTCEKAQIEPEMIGKFWLIFGSRKMQKILPGCW
jgi:hypothetical protein